RVVDLGLRLDDVEALGLESETVDYGSGADPRIRLKACGATEAECNFLVQRRQWGRWVGERVELNAMTSDQVVEWLEGKLAAAGVEKVVPDRATLETAYRRAHRRMIVQKAIDAAVEEARKMETAEIAVPEDIEEQVREAVEGSEQAWDDLLWE